MKLHFEGQSPITDADLVDYGAPPVVEVTLGFQFEQITGYNSIRAAGFWNILKDEYPNIEEQPPLEPGFETFGANDSAIVATRVELFPASSIQPRFFFANASGSELLQLQRDRLHLNWRGTAAGESYPRYPTLRARFERVLAAHRDWASSMGSIVQPTQVEIAYVNRVPLVDENKQPCGLSYLFPWLEGLPGHTENGAFQFRRKLFDESQQPIARLHFTLQYGTDELGQREAQLVFLVRGRPTEATQSHCLAMLDGGRKIIVHTFTMMTSKTAHSLWKMQ